jgi:hypothetical protein
MHVTGGTTNGVGAFTATCDGGRDVAGNQTAPVTAKYTVVYDFHGFDLPPAPQGVYNGGRVIPVKWFLTNAKGGMLSPPSSFVVMQYAANTGCAGNPEGPAINAISVGEASTQPAFTYLWQTKDIAPGCYNLMLKLDDTTTRSVIVNFR